MGHAGSSKLTPVCAFRRETRQSRGKESGSSTVGIDADLGTGESPGSMAVPGSFVLQARAGSAATIVNQRPVAEPQRLRSSGSFSVGSNRGR